MIYVYHSRPTGRDVAVRTLASGCNVIRRFRRRPDKIAFRVTAGTRRVRWSECTADVATFAGDIGMRAIQYEAGTEVIERGLRYGTACWQQQQYRERTQNQTEISGACIGHCTDLTSLKESAEWQRPQLGPNSPSCKSLAR